MPGKDIRPLHVAISVADIDASVKWYSDMLGFRFDRRVDIPQLPFKIVFIRNGAFEIEIFQHRETIAIPPERMNPNTDNQTQGTKHMCFYCEDVQGLLSELKEKGVEIIIGPQQIEDTMMGFIRDNSGICIEFIGPLNREKNT